MNRSIVIALASATALGLAGCGSGGGTASGATTSAAAPAGDGRTIALSELSKRGVAAMTKAGTVHISMSSAGETMQGEMSYKGSRSYKFTGSTGGEELTLIFVDKLLYLGGDSFKSMNDGKPYITIDPNGTDQFSQVMAPVIKTIEQASNPSELFAGVEGVTAKVVASDGDTTTYESRFTGDQMRKAAEKLLGSTAPSGASTLSTEALTLQQTFDKQDRPVKVVIKGADGMDTTVSYGDWGAAVHITAPPASQVGAFDMSGLIPTPTTS